MTPSGTDVVVDDALRRRRRRCPADAQGGDRGAVGRGRPVRPGSPRCTTEAPCSPTAATLGRGPHAVPLELDQIYTSIDDLTVALGPTGRQQGGRAHRPARDDRRRTSRARAPSSTRTIKDFGRLSTTLDDNKDELFGGRPQPEVVHRHPGRERPDRALLQRLAGQRCRTMLAGRAGGGCSASLENLSVALGEVSSLREATTGRCWAATSPG